MIAAVYIASAANRLDLELKIIRHFLLHPLAKEVRDAFIATEMKERAKSWLWRDRPRPRRRRMQIQAGITRCQK
jgi:hypothetical protein